jgi:CBS domain-containing protein
MSTQNLLASSIPLLSPADTVAKAIALCEDNKLSALPVANDGEYIGTITENSLLEVPDDSVSLADSGLLGFRPAISEYAHPYEAFTTMHDARLTILPVVDNQQRYLGSISRESLVDYFATETAIASPGGIMEIEVAPRSYSLYDIARICENEDVAILGMQMRTTPEGMLRITLKLNRTVVDAVEASFARHNYMVTEVYGRQADKEGLVDNYNLLMNYINM